MNADSMLKPVPLADFPSSTRSSNFSLLSAPNHPLLLGAKKILLPLSSLILFIALFGGSRHLPLAVDYLSERVGNLTYASRSLLAANSVWSFTQSVTRASVVKTFLTDEAVAWWQVKKDQILAYPEGINRLARSELASLKQIWPSGPQVSVKAVAPAVPAELDLVTAEKITAKISGEAVNGWDMNRLALLRIYSVLAYANINQAQQYVGHVARAALAVPEAGQSTVHFASSYLKGTGVILANALGQSRVKWGGFISTNKNNLASAYTANASFWQNSVRSGAAKLAMVSASMRNSAGLKWQNFLSSNKQKMSAGYSYLAGSQKQLAAKTRLNLASAGTAVKNQTEAGLALAQNAWHNLSAKMSVGLASGKLALVKIGTLGRLAGVGTVNTTNVLPNANANVREKLAGLDLFNQTKDIGISLWRWTGYEKESIYDVYDGLTSATAISVVNGSHTLAAATQKAGGDLALAGQALSHASTVGQNISSSLTYTGKQTKELATKNVALIYQSYEGTLDDSAAVALGVAGKIADAGRNSKKLANLSGAALTQRVKAGREAMVLTAERQIRFSAFLATKTAAGLGQGTKLALAALSSAVRETLAAARSTAQLAATDWLKNARQTGSRLGLAAKDTRSAYTVGGASATQKLDQLATALYLTGSKLETGVHQSLSAKIANNVSEPFTRLSRQSVAAAGQIDNGFILLYEEYVLSWWNSVADVLYRTGYSALAAWSGFIHGGNKQTVGISANNELKDQIKQEVMDEIKQQMGGSASQTVLNQVTGGSADQNTGMVIIPEPDSPALSELEKQQIQKAFSDKVVIYLDKSGKTGVIQPVFKNSVGSRYLFVLTPVSNQ